MRLPKDSGVTRFLGRSKYQIFDESNALVAWAEELQQSKWDLVVRDCFEKCYSIPRGRFDILFLTPKRTPFMIAHHPFCLFLQRVEIRDMQGNLLGSLQQRFSLFTKRFILKDERATPIFEIDAPSWKILNFVFKTRGRDAASVHKNWPDSPSTVFNENRNFLLKYSETKTSESERRIIMAAALIFDHMYFQKKRWFSFD